ncbi:MAG: BatA and WFA domain-containing protein, partial [Planctomycetota bacterium]|nr:BatA and WFA domain-containing protein [Planctomycetota bacterium]
MSAIACAGYCEIANERRPADQFDLWQRRGIIVSMFTDPAMLWWLAAVWPAILIFYFLKMRRETLVVSSTLLWRRSVYDLRVNAPIQMIKRNLLLFLQLLIAALIVFALARPVWRMARSQGKQTILILDCSASMATREIGGEVRLEMARREALRQIAALGSDQAAASDELCIIAAADRPDLLCGFTADKQRLRESLNRLAAKGTPGDIAAALEMAIAMATASLATPAKASGADLTNGPEPRRPTTARPSLPVTIILISDGAFAPLPYSLVQRLTAALPNQWESGSIAYVAVGQPQSDNLGFVAADLRAAGGPESGPRLFLLLQNAAERSAVAEVKVEIDGKFIDRKRVEVPGRQAAAAGNAATPGQCAVLFDLPPQAEGTLTASLSPGGNLSLDDTVRMIVKPPQPIAVALVSAGNPFLVAALDACQRLVRYEKFLPAAWPANGSEGRYDLIIFDRFAPSETPLGASLFLGAIPTLPGLAKADSDLDAAWAVDWQRTHPLLRGISLLDRLVIHDCRQITCRANWAVLIEGEGMRWRSSPGATQAEKIKRADIVAAPLLLCSLSEERRVAVLAFDILRSNWPLRMSFPLFIKNAVVWLARPGGLQQAEHHRTGEILRFEAGADLDQVRLIGPDGVERGAAATRARSFYFAEARQPGIYRLVAEGQPERLYAFNLLSPEETDNAARSAVLLGRESLPAEEKREVRYNL